MALYLLIIRTLFEYGVNPVRCHLVHCSSNFKNGTLVAWRILCHFFKTPSLYSDTGKIWSFTCIYFNQLLSLKETVIIRVPWNQDFEGVVSATTPSSQEQWPQFTSKWFCLCFVFYKSFHLHDAILLPGSYLSGESQSRAFMNILRGQRRELSAQVRLVTILRT